MAHPIPSTMVSSAGDRLALRLASAAVLAPVVLAAAWRGTPYFETIVLLGAVAMAWEWAGVASRPAEGELAAVPHWARALPAVVVAGAVGLAASGRSDGALIWGCFGGLLLNPLRVGPISSESGLLRRVTMALGTAYIAGAAVAMVWLRAQPQPGWPGLLWLFATVWATDVGAYAAGRLLGGARLAPKISPNKTWAGAAGGLAAAGAAGLAVGWALGGEADLAIILPSLAVSIVAQGGDLLESAVKRRYGVKDAGRLVPGHGGILDRADSLSAAALAVAFVARLAPGLLPQWP